MEDNILVKCRWVYCCSMLKEKWCLQVNFHKYHVLILNMTSNTITIGLSVRSVDALLTSFVIISSCVGITVHTVYKSDSGLYVYVHIM